MVVSFAVSSSRSLTRALLVFGLVVQLLYVSTSPDANWDFEGGFLELTSDTFQTFVTSHGTTVVEFYQPW
jgi:hypothetical protein